MSDILMVFDKNGEYILKNRAAIRETYVGDYNNVSNSYRRGMYYDLIGNEIPLEQIPAMRVLNGEKIVDQILQVRHSVAEKYIGVSGAPLYDDNGELQLGVICIRDTTNFIKSEKELKEAQERLLTSECEKRAALEKAIEMKDEFLSLISHEFRTPLNVINSAVQAINYFCINELPDRAKKYLDMIKLNTFRQLRLVNNLLDITRADAGRIKINKKNLDIVFLTKSILESVQAYASEKGLDLEFISRFKEKIIGIDDEKYERILLNLLSNAIKFTSEGKSIIVKLSLKKSNICIEVKDEGMGIPKDKKEVIFERFGQVDSSLSRQAEGTGIGLSLVKKFVEALGGTISVKSTVGKGSTFTILLPDITTQEESKEAEMIDLMDNRLVQVTNVEFSDIYL